MNRINNSKQLEAEKKRLKEKEQKLKNEISEGWQDIRKQFAPSTLIKDEMLCRGKAWVKEKIISRIKEKLFALIKK